MFHLPGGSFTPGPAAPATTGEVMQLMLDTTHVPHMHFCAILVPHLHMLKVYIHTAHTITPICEHTSVKKICDMFQFWFVKGEELPLHSQTESVGEVPPK